ncbi:MAG: biotin transporter BioY [Deferrisomatales bacterium]
MKSLSARELVLAGLFAALTAVGAFLKVPLEPVPFTLQPLVVFLAGVVLRPRAALFSQVVYILVGLAGLPVFARGGGPAYVLQPTFGFLVGFAVGAWAISAVCHAGRSPGGAARTVAGLLVGLVVVYGCGVAGLYLNLALFQGKAAVFRKVVWGLGAYLGFDLVKVGIAAALARPLRRAVAAASG